MRRVSWLHKRIGEWCQGSILQRDTPEGYVMTMAYDAENRLIFAQYTDSGSVVHRTEYFYSGDGMLASIKKFENSIPVSETKFVRADLLPVQERDQNNNIAREYIWGLDKGGGIGGLLNLKQAGQDYSYLYDGKGNVMAVLDSSQNVKASYRYDEFGNLMKKTGTLNQPFMFSTKRYDEQAGLSYYGYRFYSPMIGRWMTRDPLGEAGGINLYGFVGNNALNYYDPDGLIMIGIEIFARPTWARVPFPRVKSNRFIPREAQRLGKETPTRPYEPVQQPMENPIPKPNRWIQFMKDLADWLDGIGLGSTPPVTIDCSEGYI